ncbi:MAG: UbiA family prenyltransferase [Candidatus Moranbacteria bacterium]|nr:UbiA family prenyltransferase [Candidatus Moranbacteria bacterium]
MWKKFLLFLQNIENTPQSLLSYGGAFLCIIVLRLSIESGLGHFSKKSFSFIFFEFTHTFLFFLFSLLLFIFLFRFLIKESLLRVGNILLFGFFIILLPPIIDTWIFRGQGFWSFYEFDGLRGLFWRYLTLFGDSPRIGITYGVRLEVVLMTLGSAFYTYYKTQSKKRSLLALWLTYCLFFVLGTFPSWLTLVLNTFSIGLFTVSDIHVAKLFLTPETILSSAMTDVRSVLNIKMSLFYAFLSTFFLSLLFWKERSAHFLALFKNARFPQIFHHGGLLLLGSLLAWHFEELSLSLSLFSFLAYSLLIVSVIFAWITSVIINDIYDTPIDELTNPDRPLIQKNIPHKTYLTYGLYFFFFSLLFAGLVSPTALFLIFLYQVFAYMYSVPPLRIKRFPVIATLLAAFANILIFSLGYITLSQESSLSSLPASILLYLLLALTVGLTLKDFKDISGDFKDTVFTIPVLLGEALAKQVIGSLIFCIFALSPIILNQPSLFPLSFLMASLAFYTIQKGTSQKKSLFSYHRFSLLFFLLLFCYGSLLALFFFLKR